jgi:hypothetical protein
VLGGYTARAKDGQALARGDTAGVGLAIRNLGRADRLAFPQIGRGAVLYDGHFGSQGEVR